MKKRDESVNEEVFTYEDIELEDIPQKRRNVKRIVITVALVALLLLLGFKGCQSGIVPAPQWFNNMLDANQASGGLASKSIEERQAELNAKIPELMINMSMNTNPMFENGVSEGSLNIVNEEINNYPQVVQIYRQEQVTLEDGTEKYIDAEKIYESGLIPVGSHIATDKLDVALSAGEYRCIAYFNAVKETGEYVGKGAVNIKLTVLN